MGSLIEDSYAVRLAPPDPPARQLRRSVRLLIEAATQLRAGVEYEVDLPGVNVSFLNGFKNC